MFLRRKSVAYLKKKKKVEGMSIEPLFYTWEHLIEEHCPKKVLLSQNKLFCHVSLALGAG